MARNIIKRICARIKSNWQVAETTNLYKGLIQARPTAKIFNIINQSADSKATFQQAFYYNILLYLLPVVLFNFSHYLLDIFSGIDYFRSIEVLLNIISKTYFVYIIAVMVAYNTVLSMCISNIAAIESPDIDKLEGKICDCPKSRKLQQVIKGPLYYLSNVIFSKAIQYFIHPIVAWPFKINLYGQGLFDTYLANTGACVTHRQKWLSAHNMLSIGCGMGFLLTQNFSESVIGYFINAQHLDSLSSFIISDSIANLLWLFFVFNIHINPTILSTSAEYSLNFFKYNNDIVDMIYNAIKPKLKYILTNVGRANSNAVLLYALKPITKLFSLISPGIYSSSHALLTSPPVQLLLAQNRNGILVTMIWLKRLDKARFLINGSILSQQRLKDFLNRWLPESLINIIFIALTKRYFAARNIDWLAPYVNSASNNPLAKNQAIRILANLSDILLRLNNFVERKRAIKEFVIVASPTSSVLSLDSDDSDTQIQTISPSPVDMIRSPIRRARGSVASDIEIVDTPVASESGADSPFTLITPTISTSTPREHGTQPDDWATYDENGQEVATLDSRELILTYFTLMGRPRSAADTSAPAINPRVFTNPLYSHSR